MAGLMKFATAVLTGVSVGSPILLQDSPLLDLPSELRNKIYELALISDEPVHVYGGSVGRPPLLRACKQIAIEASGIFFANNRFIAHLAGVDVPKFHRTLIAIGPHHAGLIPHLCLKLNLRKELEDWFQADGYQDEPNSAPQYNSSRGRALRARWSHTPCTMISYGINPAVIYAKASSYGAEDEGEDPRGRVLWKITHYYQGSWIKAIRDGLRASKENAKWFDENEKLMRKGLVVTWLLWTAWLSHGGKGATRLDKFASTSIFSLPSLAVRLGAQAPLPGELSLRKRDLIQICVLEILALGLAWWLCGCSSTIVEALACGIPPIFTFCFQMLRQESMAWRRSEATARTRR